jgi:divalent metal cation (Fe/Co/Zn/Cd) transporter
MSLRKAVLLSACALTVLILSFLRLFNIFGSEYDLLIRWISAISLILCGVLIGMLISEKKIQARGMLASLLLFLVDFCVAPFVGVGVLMVASMFPFSRGIEPLLFGGSVMGYLLLYMGLWFWLKKKGIFKFGDID